MRLSFGGIHVGCLACSVLSFRLVKTALLSALRCQREPRSLVCLFTVRAYSPLCSQPKSAVITARTSCKRHGLSAADWGQNHLRALLKRVRSLFASNASARTSVRRTRPLCEEETCASDSAFRLSFVRLYEQCYSGLTVLLGCFINFDAPKNSSYVFLLLFFFAADALKGWGSFRDCKYPSAIAGAFPTCSCVDALLAPAARSFCLLSAFCCCRVGRRF